MKLNVFPTKKMTRAAFLLEIRCAWKTRKSRYLFPLKDTIVDKANVIYKGTCTCKEFYIGETKRNSEVRWKGTLLSLEKLLSRRSSISKS